MVNEIKSALKGWYKPAVVLVVLVFGVGIGLTNAAPLARIEPAPTPIAQRVRTEITDKVNAEGLVGTGVTLQDSNQPLNPPGGNQPLPKFSGLNVQGPILSEGVKPLMFFDDAMLYGLTDVRNGLVNGAAPGGVAAPVTIYDSLRIDGAGGTPGDLFVSGTLSGPNSAFGDTVGIKKNLGVEGDLFVNGSNVLFGGASTNIQGNIVFNDATPVEFMSGLKVTGNSTLTGNLAMPTANSYINSGDFNDNVPVWIRDALDISGKVKNPGAPFTIDDELVVGSVAVPKTLTVNGTAIINNDNPGAYSLTIQGGSLKVDNNLRAGTINSDGSTFVDNGSLWVSGGDINLNGGKLYTTNKNDFNPVVIEDPLTVNGHVRSTGGFGTYSRVASAVRTVAAGAADSVAATCPAGTILISCTPTTDSDVNFSSASWTSYVQIMSVYPDPAARTCTMWGKNTAAAADKYFGVYAMCLNPNS
ncbi:MAG: hypothetical protein WCT53_03115 [Candidatus Gracilibacteria bacterium]